MQIAEILSDLATLRLCDPSAALALVSATTTTGPRCANNSIAPPAQAMHATAVHAPGDDTDADPDLQRAYDLLALRAVFKQDDGGGRGIETELGALRQDVRKAMEGAEAAAAAAKRAVRVSSAVDGRDNGVEGERRGQDEEIEGFEDWE